MEAIAIEAAHATSESTEMVVIAAVSVDPPSQSGNHVVKPIKMACAWRSGDVPGGPAIPPKT
jgi:hypothetical protein